MNKRGFAHVEILVVILLIAIVGVVVFVVGRNSDAPPTLRRLGDQCPSECPKNPRPSCDSGELLDEQNPNKDECGCSKPLVCRAVETVEQTSDVLGIRFRASETYHVEEGIYTDERLQVEGQRVSLGIGEHVISITKYENASKEELERSLEAASAKEAMKANDYMKNELIPYYDESSDQLPKTKGYLEELEEKTTSGEYSNFHPLDEYKYQPASKALIVQGVHEYYIKNYGLFEVVVFEYLGDVFVVNNSYDELINSIEFI